MVVFPCNLFSGDTEDPWGFLASIAKLQRSRFSEMPGRKHKKVGSHPGRNCINLGQGESFLLLATVSFLFLHLGWLSLDAEPSDHLQTEHA